MEITAIIIISLCVIWTTVLMLREWNQSKWYKIGYEDACLKYDKDDDYRNKTYREEAQEKFNKEHGFDYP